MHKTGRRIERTADETRVHIPSIPSPGPRQIGLHRTDNTVVFFLKIVELQMWPILPTTTRRDSSADAKETKVSRNCVVIRINLTG